MPPDKIWHQENSAVRKRMAKKPPFSEVRKKCSFTTQKLQCPHQGGQQHKSARTEIKRSEGEGWRAALRRLESPWTKKRRRRRERGKGKSLFPLSFLPSPVSASACCSQQQHLLEWKEQIFFLCVCVCACCTYYYL